MLHCQELSLAGNEDTHNPPLVLLHGFLGDGHSWEEVARGCGRRALVVDLPGHGLSPPISAQSKDPFSDFAEAFWQLMLARSVEAVDLVGYSMGGRLAMHVALAQPERVRRLVLESAHPGLTTEAEREQRRHVDSKWADRIRREWPEILHAWHEQPVFASLRGTELLARLIEEKRIGDPMSLAAALQSFSTGCQDPLADRLSRLRMPILFVSGEMDTRYGEIGERLASQAGPTRHHIQKGAGHVVHREQPEAYLHVLKQFIQG